jgi:hypothetical protein
MDSAVVHWNGLWKPQMPAGYGPGGTLGEYERSYFAPLKYANRDPWYAKRNGVMVDMDCNTRAVVDGDILRAAAGGIAAFWFLLYATEPNLLTAGKGTEDAIFTAGMNGAYKLYQTSALRPLVKHALILEGYRSGWSTNPPASDWATFSDAYAQLLVKPYYHQYNGRPILAIFDCASFRIYAGGGTDAGGLAALNLLRTKVQALGGGNPYVVCLDNNAGAGSVIGCDVFSGYFTGYTNASNSEYPFSTISNIAKAKWTALKNTGAKVIPQVTAGWDYRPRMGSQSQYVGTEASLASWITNPTTAEWIAHVADAKAFVEAFPAACESGICLHYAWNENTEGGYIQPHRGDNFGDRMRALANLMGRPPYPQFEPYPLSGLPPLLLAQCQ